MLFIRSSVPKPVGCLHLLLLLKWVLSFECLLSFPWVSVPESAMAVLCGNSRFNSLRNKKPIYTKMAQLPIHTSSAHDPSFLMGVKR